MIFLLLAGLTGCGEIQESVETGELYRAGSVEYDTKLITVGFIQTGKESDWRDANSNNFIDTFTQENGYNLIFIDGNSDPDRQLKAAYDLLNQRVDYIIIDPIVEDGWVDFLTQAKEKGVTVIISDREVAADESLYTCWVGSNFKEEGIKAANWLKEYLEKEGRTDEDINIVLLEGTEGATAAIGRTEGLMEELDKNPKWHLVASECGNFTQGEGRTVMEDILKEHDDIDVVISENDNMMFGAMKAMGMHGVSYGVDGDVITISFDALHEAFVKMISGELHVTVECNPLIAQFAERVIQDLEEGKEVAKKQYVEEEVFTYENAADCISERLY